MKQIAVFCSAADNIDSIYFHAARDLGTWIGQNHHTLIYGGASLGLMECLAQYTKVTGGNIIGVVPSKLEENGIVSRLPNEIINTHNLSDRKDQMVATADAIVALPGGVGTFDEIFHVISAASIGYHHKRVIFYNVNHFFDPLLDCLKTIYQQHFLRHNMEHYLDVANNFEELETLLNQA
jgi:uncharacterized protein (TIGR00730 family)